MLCSDDKGFLSLERGPLGRAIALKDYSFVAGWLSRTWDKDIPPVKLIPWVEATWKAIRWGLGTWPSDGYLTIMLKNRASESGLFAGGEVGTLHDFTSCTFHVFFVSIHETEEQLRRLRREPLKESPGPASSAIERTNLAEIKPIDRTAARVIA